MQYYLLRFIHTGAQKLFSLLNGSGCRVSVAKSLQSCLALCQPYGLQPARLLCLWDPQGENHGVGCCALSRGPSDSPASLVSPALAGGFFTARAMREGPAALLHSAVDGHLGCFQTSFMLEPVLNQDGRETRFSFMLENKQRTQRRSHQ